MTINAPALLRIKRAVTEQPPPAFRMLMGFME
jgi:hypothetical protein